MELWVRIGKGKAGHYYEKRIYVKNEDFNRVLGALSLDIDRELKQLEAEELLEIIK